jgi:hypothetical protein
LSAAERGAVLARHPEWAVELVVEMTRDLTPGTPEEYRRIPWIWRAAIDVGKRNEAEQVRRLLEVSLPKASEPLLDWQAVVIGGGVINGLGLVGVWPRERIEELLGSSELRARWERSLELAAVMTDNEKVPQGTRYDALRMIAMRDWKDCGEQLERYLGKGVPGELQQGAVSGLCDVPHPRAGELLVKYWADLVPPVRGFALDGLLRTPQRARLLQDAVEAGKISAEEVGPERLQKMRDVAGK